MKVLQRSVKGELLLIDVMGICFQGQVTFSPKKQLFGGKLRRRSHPRNEFVSTYTSAVDAELFVVAKPVGGSDEDKVVFRLGKYQPNKQIYRVGGSSLSRGSFNSWSAQFIPDKNT